MRLTNKVQQLEKRYWQQQQLTGTNLKQVPNDWEDFVSLTVIRSGGAMKQFKPYEYQLLLSSLMDEYNNIVIVKSRQLGVTQTVTSKFLHRASLNPAYCSMSFLRNQEDASAIARRARQMLDGLKEYVLPATDNLGYLKLKNAGELYFKNSSKEGSRSYDSVLDFLFDESAFSENIEQIYAASSPSGALAGDLITKLIVSTPSAKSGWYWDMLNADNGSKDIEELCIRVAKGEVYKNIPGIYWFVDGKGTVKLILHWTCHPVYKQNSNYLEYRQQQDGTDEETVLREYDLRFVDSAVAVFSSEIVRANAIGNTEEYRDDKAIYYLGLDTSTTGNDYCVCIVLKEKDKRYSVVNIYRKRQQSSQYHLYQIGELIRKYRPEIAGIEITGGVGTLYLEQLSREFKNLKCEAIRTSGDTKPMMVSNLQLALEKECLFFPSSSPIVEELLSFRRQGKKLEAPSGKHDDCIMALCFALAVSPFSIQKQNAIKIPQSYFQS